MTTRIIMHPDILPTKNSLLIINALDSEIETLILWLKSVDVDLDIHLYHSQMPDSDWAVSTIESVDTVLISTNLGEEVDSAISAALANKASSKIVCFGKNEFYSDLIQYFLSNHNKLPS